MIVAGLIYKTYRVMLYSSSNTSRAMVRKTTTEFPFDFTPVDRHFIDDNPIGIMYAQCSRCARMADLL
jgi:hypothetical protein